jgi:hypothetical protein
MLKSERGRTWKLVEVGGSGQIGGVTTQFEWMLVIKELHRMRKVALMAI